ncbi:MAG: type II secretion system protein [Sedimentisphaerales bacterium]
MKREKTGFTLVELLTVLAIIALLVSLLIPSLTLIRNTAKEAKQKAQLTEIGLALTAFRTDYGDYPPSYWMPPPGTGPPGPPATDYCGAQKLAEALLGRDLLGFHPKSDWSAANLTFYPAPPIPTQNLEERKGPYLELATTNAFKLGDLYGPALTASQLNPDTFVICDSFGVKKITIAPGQTAKAGTPILYYRANTSSKTIEPPTAPFDRIYNIFDNVPLASQLMSLADNTKAHQLGNPATMQVFYDYIRDLKVTALWPYRPDSYILISAGADGLYGTKDDICNFGN